MNLQPLYQRSVCDPYRRGYTQLSLYHVTTKQGQKKRLVILIVIPWGIFHLRNQLDLEILEIVREAVISRLQMVWVLLRLIGFLLPHLVGFLLLACRTGDIVLKKQDF